MLLLWCSSLLCLLLQGKELCAFFASGSIARTPLAPSLCMHPGRCASSRASFSVLPVCATAQALFANSTSSRLCDAGCALVQQAQSAAHAPCLPAWRGMAPRWFNGSPCNDQCH